MIDEQLVLSHLQYLRQAVEDIKEHLNYKKPIRAKANPTLEDVQEYAKLRGREDIAKAFFEHYTLGKTKKEQWLNGGGNPIYTWKNTFIQWENRNKVSNDKRSVWE